ncbi:MAG: tRNA (adenosine(37)-N6)-dimethylallyltransferase MiaA [Candidatus Parcubacteria bacterium]|nr:tRNA (adenosine(37)-N6)-dimethylallyltransferase MiaA [Candidatus Parcubacteria bacterium]
MQNKKLIVILGPTASGKSDLSVKLAKEFKGEIISADSRQVYKGMDIGTGKITKKEMAGVPHHLLSVVEPKRKFTVTNYQNLAGKKINEIFKRNNIPFLVGGTGFYIQSITEGIQIPQVKPDWRLRKKLNSFETEELFKMLKKKDPQRARCIDRFNRHRLIRAMEIVIKTKKPIPLIKKELPEFKMLMIGIKKSPAQLRKLIKERLMKRLKQGLIAEVKQLKKSGLSWKKLEDSGLEYKYVSQYLQNKIIRMEMIEKIQIGSEHYAKRQMTWFKRNKRINWVKNYREVKILTRNFIYK